MLLKNIYRYPLKELEKLLKTNFNDGLHEHYAEKRLKKFGSNLLPKRGRPSIFWIFFKQFHDPLIYILIAAALIKFAFSDYVDVSIICVVLLVNTFVGTFQEWRSGSILESLQDFVISEVTVIRDGEREIISEVELVPGDIIILEEGSRIPADCRIVQSNELKVDESIITGESKAVKKNKNIINKKNVKEHSQTNMLFAGAYIVSGNAIALVVATAKNTVIGKLDKVVEEIATEIPLKADFLKLSKYIILITVVMIIVIFGIGYLRGNKVEDIFFILISLLVSVVPEGLPIVVTAVLSVGVYRMAKSKVLVRKLTAIETLGRIENLIIDKTGTLTRNEQIISNIMLNEMSYTISGSGYHSSGTIFKDGKPIKSVSKNSDLFKLGVAAILFNKSKLEYDKSTDSYKLKGEPIEAAFGIFAKKLNLNIENIKSKYAAFKEIPFNYKNRMNTIFYDYNGQKHLLIVGAPEAIFEKCTKVEKLQKNNLDQMLNKGLRVIAVAHKKLTQKSFGKKVEAMSEGSKLLALVGMQDAIREGIDRVVKQLKDFNVNLSMATGDHKDTALYVAKKTSIIPNKGDNSKVIIDGSEFDTISETDLKKRLLDIKIFSRVTPKDKMRIVNGYHSLGKIVGMTEMFRDEYL